RSMYPVELVVRRSGTHRNLTLAISQSRGLSHCSISLGNVRSTSRSGLRLSKYPPKNTRQASVLISEQREPTWHSLHISFLFEFFSFAPSQLKIEPDFNYLAHSVGAAPNIQNSYCGRIITYS